MRLLNVKTRKLEQFFDKKIPEYAILSHTWGPEELTYDDITRAEKLQPSAKIDGCCEAAMDEGIDWVWIDTICIDKSSSAELSEAINSMYAWYRDSKICYAYLSDVASDGETLLSDLAKPNSDFFRSKWFTRGWTLQELIAPEVLAFFNREWQPIGTRTDYGSESWFPSKGKRPCTYRSSGDLSGIIHRITGVPEEVLGDAATRKKFSVAARMTWAAGRNTTRKEDMAYCLMGLFDINMPMLYGEGDRAFVRLQEEIIRTSDDESILVWGIGSPGRRHIYHSKLELESRLLAQSPADFKGSEKVEPVWDDHGWNAGRPLTHYSLTNKGLLMERPLFVMPPPLNMVLVPLNCFSPGDGDAEAPGKRLGSMIYALPVQGQPVQDSQLFVSPSSTPSLVDAGLFSHSTCSQLRFYLATSTYTSSRLQKDGDPNMLGINVKVRPDKFQILGFYANSFYFSRFGSYLELTRSERKVSARSPLQKRNDQAEKGQPEHAFLRIEFSDERTYDMHCVQRPKDSRMPWSVSVAQAEPGDTLLNYLCRSVPPFKSFVSWPRKPDQCLSITKPSVVWKQLGHIYWGWEIGIELNSTGS